MRHCATCHCASAHEYQRRCSVCNCAGRIVGADPGPAWTCSSCEAFLRQKAAATWRTTFFGLKG